MTLFDIVGINYMLIADSVSCELPDSICALDARRGRSLLDLVGV